MSGCKCIKTVLTTEKYKHIKKNNVKRQNVVHERYESGQHFTEKYATNNIFSTINIK